MAALLAIIIPFILIFVETIVPNFPFIIEEISKLVVVFVVRKETNKKGLVYAAASGLLFGFSETVIYSNLLNYSGSTSLLAQRLLITGSMHAITTVIIFFGFKNKYTVVLSLVAAMIIHYLFNTYVTTAIL